MWPYYLVALVVYIGLLASVRSMRFGFSLVEIINFIPLFALAGALGSKLLHVAELRFNSPIFGAFGSTQYGAILAIVAMSAWYNRSNKGSNSDVLAVLWGGIFVGGVFGRLACISAGCCAGRRLIADEALRGLVPTAGDGRIAFREISCAASLVFLFLHMIWSRRFSSDFLATIWVFIYAVWRLLESTIRDHHPMAFGLNNVELGSVILISYGVVRYTNRPRVRSKEST